MFTNRLKEFLKYYTEAKRIEDLDSLANAILAEQFLETLPTEIRQFVVSKQPVNSEQGCEIADLFSEVAHNTNKSALPRNVMTDETGHISQQRSNHANRINGNSQNNGFGNKKPIICWGCNSTNHKYATCPHTAASNVNAVTCQRIPCYSPPVPHNAIIYTAAIDERCDQIPNVFPLMH